MKQSLRLASPLVTPLPGSLHSSQAGIHALLSRPHHRVFAHADPSAQKAPLAPSPSSPSQLTSLQWTTDLTPCRHPPSPPLLPHRPHCCVSNQLSTLPPHGLCTCMLTALYGTLSNQVFTWLSPSFFPFSFHFIFDCTAWQVGFNLPNQGLNPCPLCWQCQV